MLQLLSSLAVDVSSDVVGGSGTEAQQSAALAKELMTHQALDPLGTILRYETLPCAVCTPAQYPKETSPSAD